jgi:hypothetical protein
MIKIYEEGRTLILEVKSYNSARVLSTPSALRYRIDDSSGTQIVDWTTVNNPASTQNITITAAQNYLLSQDHSYETRKITIEITSSEGAIIPYEVSYKLRNLQFYSPS